MIPVQAIININGRQELLTPKVPGISAKHSETTDNINWQHKVFRF